MVQLIVFVYLDSEAREMGKGGQVSDAYRSGSFVTNGVTSDLSQLENRKGKARCAQ